jgi:nucleolar protein 9
LLAAEATLTEAHGESLINALQEFTAATCDCLFDMVSSKYGSFVARRLLCILSGRDVSFGPKIRISPAENVEKGNEVDAGSVEERETGSKNNKRRQLGNLAARVDDEFKKAEEITSSQQAPHPKLLNDIVQAVLSSDYAGPELVELVTGPFSGPFFQSLVLATAGTQYSSSLIFRLLGGSARAGAGSVTSDMMFSLMTDKGGSHMVEACLTSASDDTFQKLCSTAFKGRIVSLAQHPTANFAVQAALSSVQKSAQLKRMCEDLCPAIPSLLRARRGGVVVTLLSACKRLEVKQKDVADAVWEAVASDGNNGGNAVVNLISLDAVGSAHETKGKRLSPIGCSSMVTILQFPAEASSRWNKAMAQLQSEEVLMTAQDPGGCRVLEAYLQQSSDNATLKTRSKVFEYLHGFWAKIALGSNAGCRFVQNCYDMLHCEAKESILSDLVKEETRLSTFSFGQRLLRHCNVDAYVKGPLVWRQGIQRGNAVRLEYEEMLSERKTQRKKKQKH